MADHNSLPTNVPNGSEAIFNSGFRPFDRDTIHTGRITTIRAYPPMLLKGPHGPQVHTTIRLTYFQHLALQAAHTLQDNRISQQPRLLDFISALHTITKLVFS
mgnify:FL=1